MKTPPPPINDDTALNVSQLARYMRISRDLIYRDINDGYVFEFPRLKRTTAKHYKDWHRLQPEKKKPTESQLTPADLERLQREQHRLRLASGRAGEPSSKRGSRTASPRASTPCLGSAQPS